ncbi:hypothetical protein N7532_007342 [Penicillium argentinense]|uniref:STEEP1 domain-containing protein n=1 Tax=Penicillium argentinense TaxID=1131581 RepID=A0A9W9F7N8_9EURO|nr:uncharacterized protein N7532_007342 [Penicillium argentinense]KAJ5095051.1 hypothetical protein N7532_007342 [Penicillium argentinense]
MNGATRLQIRTQHCSFCNHLLLATTRDIKQLPRRTNGSKDTAIILPLSSQSQDPDSDTTPDASGKHATVLLSTTIPDKRSTLIRRADGIEKRILLRCGRCRAVAGYYLDRVHWENQYPQNGDGAEGDRPPAVYLLPGAVVQTENMGEEDGGVGEMEWKKWAETN